MRLFEINLKYNAKAVYAIKVPEGLLFNHIDELIKI